MGVMSASESNGMFLYTLGLTTWLLDTTPITEPSLGARTICVVPVMPPAPGRFSMTMGWPSALARLVLMARMAPSAPEPADSGRITRSGLPSPWAYAMRGRPQAAAPSAAAPVARAWRRVRSPTAAGAVWDEAMKEDVLRMGLSPVVGGESWGCGLCRVRRPRSSRKNQAMAPLACSAATSSAV